MSLCPPHLRAYVRIEAAVPNAPRTTSSRWPRFAFPLRRTPLLRAYVSASIALADEPSREEPQWPSLATVGDKPTTCIQYSHCLAFESPSSRHRSGVSSRAESLLCTSMAAAKRCASAFKIALHYMYSTPDAQLGFNCDSRAAKAGARAMRMKSGQRVY